MELAEPDALPEFLGGTCTCPEHGGCLKTSASPGPWEDYEIIKPVGIRKKQEIEAIKDEETKNNQNE